MPEPEKYLAASAGVHHALVLSVMCRRSVMHISIDVGLRGRQKYLPGFTTELSAGSPSHSNPGMIWYMTKTSPGSRRELKPRPTRDPTSSNKFRQVCCFRDFVGWCGVCLVVPCGYESDHDSRMSKRTSHAAFWKWQNLMVQAWKCWNCLVSAHLPNPRIPTRTMIHSEVAY